MPARPIALVADVGESFGNYSFGNDEALLGILSTTNVACGFHAGDPRTMDATVARCVKEGIEIGAHPGYPDLVGFGRRRIEATENEIRTDVLYQLGALSAFTTAHGSRISHVAPHGRLGSLSRREESIANGIAEAVLAFDPTLLVIAEPGLLADKCRTRGIPVAHVFLADRGYGPDGFPVWRDHPGALLHDPDEIGRRAVQFVETGTITSVEGAEVTLPFQADVMLVHGDHPRAVENAASVRSRLKAAAAPVLGIREVLRAREAHVTHAPGA